MSKFSLDKEMSFEVKVTFISKGNDAPVSGEGHIVFGHKAFDDTFHFEKLPDFYFVLYKNKIPVFQSKVMEDMDMNLIEQFHSGKGEVVDLGTYLIEAW